MNEKFDKLAKAADELIRLLNEDYDPHCIAIVSYTGIEILSSKINIPNITKHIKD